MDVYNQQKEADEDKFKVAVIELIDNLEKEFVSNLKKDVINKDQKVSKKNKNKWGFIDKNGKVVIEPPNHQ